MSEQVANAERLVRELVDYSTLNRSEELMQRLEVLLADFIICVASGNKLQSGDSLLKHDGAIGLVTRLASQSAFEDKDDLDWSAVNHPGSVVFAASFAIALEQPKYRGNFLTSALTGMRASASAAHFFGPAHRKRWHITATAGTFGAVCAASAAIGLDNASAQRALHLAGTNMGGLGQVSRELQGTPRFNRAAAAALGVASAFGAYESIPAIENLWEGDRGLLEVFDLAGTITDGALIKDGISTVRVRTFPATGFIQSALLGVSQLAERHSDSGALKRLTVTVNGGVFPILNDPRKERWWNLALNCAAAWASKDPMNLTPAPEIEGLVTAVGGDIPLGSAHILLETSAGTYELTVNQAPGIDLFSPTEVSWRERKWLSMIGPEYNEILDCAKLLVTGKDGDQTWIKLNKFLREE
jgi:hypothetical protein